MKGKNMIFNLGRYKWVLFAVALMSTRNLSAGSAEDDAYFHLTLGGDFAMAEYGSRDPRFVFGFDTGNQFLSLPVSFSYGQELWIIGAKPRVQYLMAPLAQYPNIRFGPGFGPVFNFWNADVGGTSVKVFELGAQLSGHIQFVLNDTFSIMFSPIMVDLNFWRHASADIGGLGSFSDSETHLRVIYSAVLGVGLVF